MLAHGQTGNRSGRKLWGRKSRRWRLAPSALQRARMLSEEGHREPCVDCV